MKKLSQENKIVAFIIIIAALLRLWNYWQWSFIHDELSQFIQLNNSSLSELLFPADGRHTEFITLFLWGWTKTFGFSEAAVRLPFVLAGIFSVALIYLIAKRWFGITTACFASLAFAILDFPILYSQLALPYSFGLLFCLLAAWFWTLLLFDFERKKYFNALCFGTATAFCILTHYFAILFVMIVASTGLLFINNKTWKPFLLSIALPILLFFPVIKGHLHQFTDASAFIYTSDFIWKFVLFAFNDSPFVLISMISIALIALMIYHLGFTFTKFHFISIAWFLLPFAILYCFYSNESPALQYPSLLFSFPFFLLFIFSFFPKDNSADLKQNKKLNNVLLVSTGLILLFSTVIEQNFFKKEYFGVFKDISSAVVDLQNKYGSKNITTVLNTSDKKFFDFYFKQADKTVPYDFKAGDDPRFIATMMEKINSSQADYFLYGWSNFRSDYEIPEMIKRKFPCIVYDEKHFNSQVTLFGKADSCRRDTSFYAVTSFENTAGLFSFNGSKKAATPVHSGKNSLEIDPDNEFGITLISTVKKIFPDNEGCVNLSAWIYTTEDFDAQFVVDIGIPKGKREWQAKLLPQFVKTTGKWQEVFATVQLPSTVYPDDEVKIYLWNPNKKSFYLDDVVVSSFTDSKYNYYGTSYRK